MMRTKPIFIAHAVLAIVLAGAVWAHAAKTESKYGPDPSPTPESSTPQTAQDFFVAAVEAFRKGDSRNAEFSVKQSISMDPRNPDYHYLLGKIFLFRAAEKNRLEIRDYGVDSPETNYVQRYVKGREELELAKSSFEIVTKLQPGAADAWLNLGTCEDNLGNEDAAATAFRHAVSLAPFSTTARDAYNNLGLLYQAANKPAEALSAYEDALRIDPTFTPTRVNLQKLLAKNPKLKKDKKKK